VVGVEFATASVTSPGLEAFLGAGNAALFEGPLLQLIDDLQYANISDRGYLVVSFSPDETTASWRFVTNIDSTNYGMLDDRAQDITVSADDLLIA
jgi:alkaline phosphatase D